MPVCTPLLLVALIVSVFYMCNGYVIVAGDFVKTGGMDRANWALARYLTKSDIPVHLVAHRVDPELTACPSVTVTLVPKVLNSYFLASYGLDWWGRLRTRQFARKGFKAIVNGGNCLVGAINWVHYVHHVPWKGRRSRLHVAGKLLRHRARQREKKALARAQPILVNSDRTKNDLLAIPGVYEDRIHRVYYGVDPMPHSPLSVEERIAIRKPLGLPSEAAVIAFVGALTDDRKGFDVLFEAWARLCSDASWTSHLAVIGVGRTIPEWCRRASQRGFASRVHFLGFQQNVPNLLRACDLLVSPTRYEAYGLAVHEAVCVGLPAMVSKSAGVAERYPEVLRDLLLPDDVDADHLALCLRSIIPKLRYHRPVVDAFSSEFRKHTWDNMAEQIIRISEASGSGACALRS